MHQNQSSNINNNWFENFKKNLNFNECIKKLDLTTCKVIEIITCFGVGFFFGFLLKRYSKIFIICLFFLILSLFLLDNFKIIIIDWTKIKIITGINPSQSLGGFFNNIFDWAKSNLITVCSGLIGFILGYKIG